MINSTEAEIELWSIVLDHLQLTLSILGAIANIITLFILYQYITTLSSGVSVLLKHQSFVDAISCIIAAILLMETPFWKTGLLYLDVVICHCWQGQAIYWAFIYLSALNLILISLERYIAVVKPFFHTTFTMYFLKKSILLIYVIAAIIIVPSFMQTRYIIEKKTCVSEYTFEGMGRIFYAYSIVWLFMVYLVPVSMFIGLYGKILFTMNGHKHTLRVSEACARGAGKSMRSTQNKMTQSAICITTVYTLTLGFDSWYYALGYTEVTKYEFGSKMQKIGVFLAVLNSVINPLIYAVMMPKFRRCYIQIFTSFRIFRTCKTKDNLQTVYSTSGNIESTSTELKEDAAIP